MVGWDEVRRPFREALIAAYDWNKLRVVLEHRCDRRLDLITSANAGFEKVVDDVIVSAVRSGWLERLARGALDENPSNTHLQATVPLILAGVAAEGKLYYQRLPPDPSREYFEPKMVRIPAGEFVMGSDRQEQPEENPRHLVPLPAFVIASYPVTNDLFYEFIRSTGRVATRAMSWNGNRPFDDKRDHPVAGVTWEVALEYCDWLWQKTKKRYWLPTEAQWEKAARGEDGRLYPWGNSWEEGRCNGAGELTAVDAFSAQNEAYGCFDMVGNAREWTVTAWGLRPDKPDRRFSYPWREDGRNDPDEPLTTLRVVRGGRYQKRSDCRCSARGGWLPNNPGPGSNRIGFRVVLLAE